MHGTTLRIGRVPTALKNIASRPNNSHKKIQFLELAQGMELSQHEAV